MKPAKRHPWRSPMPPAEDERIRREKLAAVPVQDRRKRKRT
jgi:hypothetical protein